MERKNKTTGTVAGIVANLVIVKVDGPVAQNEICFIKHNDERLMAEVIKVVGVNTYVQVFESTRGLKIGSGVEFEGHMLEVTLGPGILSRNYDGLQNDLDKMDGVFLTRGEYTDPLNREVKWLFKPLAKPGESVSAGSWLGEVDENSIPHRIMVPFKMDKRYKLKSVAAEGEYTVDEIIAVVVDEEGQETPLSMVQKWPVKMAIKAYKNKPRPFKLLETGVRCIDTLNPITEGGTGFIPGPFGTGKTVCSMPFQNKRKQIS
jgi:V/A-type H+/Na+-transporting ATPase subunit A